MVPNYRGGQIVAGLSPVAPDGARQRGRSWTIAAGRQISLRQRGAQSDHCTRTVKPSADEVPLGWGVPEGRRVLRGCHEPLAGSGGAVRSIGGVWFGANRACRRACRDAPCFAMAGLAVCEVVAGLSPAARNVVGPGEMRRDELCTAADVGTLGERVERAYGDWLSAAVVGIVAWPVLGE